MVLTNQQHEHRLRVYKTTKTDREAARALRMKPTAFGAWRKGQNLPLDRHEFVAKDNSVHEDEHGKFFLLVEGELTPLQGATREDAVLNALKQLNPENLLKHSGAQLLVAA